MLKFHITKRVKETQIVKQFDVDLSNGGEGSPFVAGRWNWMWQLS